MCSVPLKLPAKAFQPISVVEGSRAETSCVLRLGVTLAIFSRAKALPANQAGPSEKMKAPS
jgi:hypothetical protein